MNIFTQFFKRSNSTAAYRQEVTHDLLRREAKIGGQLFGPVPKGVQREFFCLDRHVWVWYERWVEDGMQRSRTTKYMIRPNELLRSVNGGSYERASLQEARNFERAVNGYVNRVRKEIYGLPQAA